MSDWPDSPLIRVTSEGWRGVPLHGALAASAGLSASGTSLKYLIIQGPGTGQLMRRDDPDSGSIISWEEVVPVPADDLKLLRGEFRGASLSDNQLRALLQVTSCLAPKAASPLDQGVSAVEEALSGSMTSLDTSSDEYLALLLEALPNFQEFGLDPVSSEKTRALSRIVRLCVELVAEFSSTDGSCAGRGALEALAEVRGRVESDPAIGGLPAMAALAESLKERIVSNSHEIAAKLEGYLDSGYFAGVIRDVYMLINHIYFLERQVVGLKATIARMQSDTGEE